MLTGAQATKSIRAQRASLAKATVSAEEAVVVEGITRGRAGGSRHLLIRVNEDQRVTAKL